MTMPDDDKHDIARALSVALEGMISNGYSEGIGVGVDRVCQWPEKQRESVFVFAPMGTVVRIRIDVLSMEEVEREIDRKSVV